MSGCRARISSGIMTAAPNLLLHVQQRPPDADQIQPVVRVARRRRTDQIMDLGQHLVLEPQLIQHPRRQQPVLFQFGNKAN